MITLLILSSFTVFSQEPESIIVSSNPVLLENGEIELKVLYTYPMGYHQSYLPDFFTVKSNDENFIVSDIEYPDGVVDEYGIAQFYKSAELTVYVKQIGASNTQTLNLHAGYQLCDDNGVCFIPGSKDIRVNLPSGFSTASTASTADSGMPFGLLLQYLIFAFLGGLILNIMPCVLPVLSIKALHLIKQSEEDHESIKTHSLSYGAGVLAMFLGLALLIIIIQQLGNQVSWGFQFQNPYFVLALASVMIIFSLGLFDVYIINIPGMSFAAEAQNKRGYTGSFLSGLFAVILGAPCMGPFLGTALGFAFSQPPLVILLLFAFIALGLALPFVLLGFFPKLIKRLPKAGKWMNTFKEFLGFVLLAFALFWLVMDVLYYQISWNAMIAAFAFILALSMFAWIFGKTQTIKAVKRRIIRLIAFAVLVASGFYFLPSLSETPSTKTLVESDTLEFSPDLIEELQNQNTAVFLEFSAKWCFTCKINKEAVLNTSEVKDFFSQNNIIHVLGDYTNADPVIGEWLRKFDRAGVPLYVAFVPGRDAIVLPEAITAADIFTAFEAVKQIAAPIQERPEAVPSGPKLPTNPR